MEHNEQQTALENKSVKTEQTDMPDLKPANIFYRDYLKRIIAWAVISATLFVIKLNMD